MTKYSTFQQLHQQSEAFLLANAWNPESAKIFEQAGAKAIGTSSAALANAFGYDDGENIPFEDLLFIAKRIVESVSLPVTVDLERGYGNNAAEIFNNITRLYDAGVVGINIEDSLGNGKRGFHPIAEFAAKINGIKEMLIKNNISFFINVRTDGFLLNLTDALEQTLERLPVYEAAGADGIFIPCITDEKDIATSVKGTKLPVNVMCMPSLPDFKRLSELGVKRISMGGFAHNKVYKELEQLVNKITNEQSFAPLFE